MLFSIALWLFLCNFVAYYSKFIFPQVFLTPFDCIWTFLVLFFHLRLLDYVFQDGYSAFLIVFWSLGENPTLVFLIRRIVWIVIGGVLMGG
jgi:hypothetical protein